MAKDQGPDILINNRRGGIAESDSLMRDGDCAYMENLDGRSNPAFLQLNNKVTLAGTTGSGLGIDMIDSYVWCDNGEVYVIGGGIQPMPATGQILAVSRISISGPSPYIAGYLGFYRTGGQIKAFLVPINSSGTAVWASTVTNYGIVYDYLTNTNNPFSVTTSNDNVYIINYESSYVYFSVGKQTYVMQQRFITASQGRMETYTNYEQDIKGMTLSGYLVNVYLYNGMKYFWQGVQNKQTSGSIDLGIKRILAVTQAKNRDYILACGFVSENSCLFVSQGQEIQLLKEGNYIFDGTTRLSKFYVYPLNNKNRSTSNQNMTFFAFDGDNGKGVVSLGTRNELTPISWINEYVNSDIDDIGAISYAGDANFSPILYMCAMEGSVGKVYSMNFLRTPGKKHQLEGVRYTKKYLSGTVGRKKLDRFRFRYDKPAGCSIEIAYAVDGSNNYTVLGNLPDQKDFEGITVDRSTNERYEIQFRITMTSNNEDNTPKLYIMEGYATNTSR